MKKVIFTIVSVFFMIGLFGQIDREKVLIEVATGTWCVWCPSVARAIDDLHANGDPVAVIEHHNGDPYANEYSNARNSYYGVSGYPNTQFDGSYNKFGGGSTGDLYPTFKGIVDGRMNIQTPFKIEIYGENTGDEYDIVVIVKKFGDYEGGNLKVQFALTESHIPVIWFDMDEINSVNRLMVPDANGTAVDFSSTDEVEVELSFTFNNSWDINNCELIAFIQDDNGKEALHSNNVHILDLEQSPTGFQAGFVATTTNCDPPLGVHFYSDCIGDPISWNWYFEGGIPEVSYDENPNITYMEEGGYDVQLIVSDGTDIDTAFYEKYINVYGLPEVSWDVVPELCNEDWDPYELTEGQPEGGLYSGGDYIIDGMYFDSEGLEAGEYPVTYTYTSEYGCINSANHTVTVVNCVGIGENQSVGLELFPNPTNGLLNLNISANQFNNADLRIIDAVGKEVYRQNGLNIDGSYSTSIDLSEHPQGIYFVIIKGENQQASKKVFLNK